ncbi:multicopper oxidase [Metarhizium robertsii]|uniref:Multicopper oxidase n=2 Tax=Metarhizium robertsii TaxID=568076 RepID=A0A014MU75_9HYPO|nr:multicopper oxidase [Metarhizium robertsii]
MYIPIAKAATLPLLLLSPLQGVLGECSSYETAVTVTVTAKTTNATTDATTTTTGQTTRSTLASVTTTAPTPDVTPTYPRLPMFLPDGSSTNSSGVPWGDMNLMTNNYVENPKTGVVRSYDFTVSRGLVSADGHPTGVILVNGQFPGPLIEANWGDTIQVTVHNNIFGPEEGVSFHWHGLPQRNKPWEDGVPAVTQCPITSGKSFTYSFEAEFYGTSWYHSHYSAQYSGGLSGPMVIYGPAAKGYDVDIGPIMLSDWYHKPYFTLVEETMAPKAAPEAPRSDNNLINGRNSLDCTGNTNSSQTACGNMFKFSRGKVHRLRLINSGSESIEKFSIDGHVMEVIANDFVPVKPYKTEVVTLGIGQRSDVLVTADAKDSAYWMRSTIPAAACGLNASQLLATAVVYYDDLNTTAVPQSQPWNVTDPQPCLNDLTKSEPILALDAPQPDLLYKMEVQAFQNESKIWLFSFDGQAFRGNYNKPTLQSAAMGNSSFEKEWNVKNTNNAKAVRVYVHNATPLPHPLHLHGFDSYILRQGDGEWDGVTIDFPKNPPRRDVVMVRALGHVVIQFDAANNPGLWPFHCHVAWHASAGFFSQFLVGSDALQKMNTQKTVLQVLNETCLPWGEWTLTNIPNQIDSGL